MELCDWIRRNNMALVGSSVEPRGIHTVQSNMPLCVNTHNRQQKRNSIGNHVSSITMRWYSTFFCPFCYCTRWIDYRHECNPLKWVQIPHESYSPIVTELGDSITLWPHCEFEYLFVSITENKWKSSYEFTFKWDCFSTKVFSIQPRLSLQMTVLRLFTCYAPKDSKRFQEGKLFR